MDITTAQTPAGPVALCRPAPGENAPVRTAQDGLDLLATVHYEYGCNRMVLWKACLDDAFFDLRTGLAGDILQKFSNYHMQLAILGDFSGYTSKALRDFIHESNQGGTVCFVPDEPAALAWLDAHPAGG